MIKKKQTETEQYVKYFRQYFRYVPLETLNDIIEEMYNLNFLNRKGQRFQTRFYEVYKKCR